MIRVQGFSAGERRAVEWALEGQVNAKAAFDTDDEREAEGFDFTVPHFDDDGLVIEDKDAVDDLLYRLEVQLGEMAESESRKTKEGLRARREAIQGAMAAARIRAETGR